MVISENTTENSITLGGEEVPYTECYLPHIQLNYYPENPRIYSVVYSGDETPTQEEIEARLQSRNHVKELVGSIEANGGLINPVWVRDGDHVVIEGNNRLAAYRILGGRDAIRWGEMKCNLLPEDIDEDKIFSFLCQCHVIGREDWKPYEQAGILWRRNKLHGDSTQRMAKEMGISIQKVNRLIEVYSFMVDHDDRVVDHWSYYFEYFKSQNIHKQRKLYPELDNIVVMRIKSGAISRAEDIRDKLTKVAGVGGKLLERFMTTPKSLDSCYLIAKQKSEDIALYNTLNIFRIYIGDLDNRQLLLNMAGINYTKCKWELEKIEQSVKKMLKRM